MKKINIMMTSLLVFLCGINYVKATDYDYYCTKEAASQLSKIIYHEAGANSALDPNENFFMKISTAAVVINNANSKTGNTFYEQLYNLTDNNYDRYSTYKDDTLENVVPSEYRGEILYISELVLTGQYTFPSNMTLQASEQVVKQYGNVWKVFFNDNDNGYKDLYIGYENSNLKATDIYQNNISDNSVDYYMNLANNLKKSDYSAYTVDTVCSGINSINQTNNSETNENVTQNNNSTTQQTNSSTIVSVCTNPDILRVIYFFLIIIDIVKIIIPIALIILGIIDFSKAVVISDEKVQKKSVNLFMKRILYAVLVFAVPWIVEVLMVTLGNVFRKEGVVNFTDCIENANAEKIAELEELQEDNEKGLYCWQCNENLNLYQWGTSASSSNCPSDWSKVTKTKEECGTKKCYQCNGDSSLYAWTIGESYITSSCPSGWHTRSDLNEESCK